MADTYLQFDEYAAARFRQTIADAVERGITEGLAQVTAPPDRDRLAAMAMQGALSGPSPRNGEQILDWHEEQLAAWAYRVADAMLAARAEGSSHV